jgi:uncharacterized protein (TIGR02284 family)
MRIDGKALTLTMRTINQHAVQMLLKINTDRSEGYRVASEISGQKDLQEIFRSFSAQSQNFSRELSAFLQDFTADHSDNRVGSSAVQRPHIVSNYTDRNSLLSEFEFREEAVHLTYDQVLSSSDLDPELQQIMQRQKEQLHKSHGRVRSLYFNI